MVKQGLRYIHGYLQIRFSGEETERFLNLCSSSDMTLWNIQKEPDCQTAYLSIEDFRNLRPAARKTKTKVRILRRYGLPFFFQRNRKRKAFFLGILIFAFLIYLLSLRIWNIHVEGNSAYSTQTILTYLEENDVFHGISKKDVNCSEIAAMLRRHFPDLTWVSARIEGTRLILEMKENHENKTDADDTDQPEQPCDIVAPKSGKIVSIITRRGVPQVQEGQSFEKGDILVSGAIEIKNDAQEVTGYEYVAADADIYADTAYSYYDEFPMDYQERRYTGENSRSFFFTAFQYRIDFGFPPAKDIQYDQITSTSPVYLTENFLLPFSYGTTETRPYEVLEKKYTEEEALEKANGHLYTFLKNLTQKGVEIYRKDVKIDTSANTCVMKGKIYVKEKILKTSPTEKKEVTKERTSDT
ncbi:MAG: sporulation protein YqfD [Ruminococcus sp.]